MRRSDSFRRYLLLGLSGPVIALNVWLLAQVFHYFEQLITVVTVAAVLALLLNYLVTLLENRVRLSRAQAISFVLILALGLLTILGFTLLPIVIDQATRFLEGIPGWLNTTNTALEQYTRDRRLPLNLSQITTQIEAQVQAILSLLPGLAIGTLGRLFDTLLVVVLAFYMLLYGDRLWLGLINLLPSKVGTALSKSIQLNFQRFFTGQLLLASFMVTFLIPTFLILRVDFGLLFALLIGMFELIPFIGATLGIALVMILVMFQKVWLGIQVAIAAIIIQQIKDNIISPKLFGNFIGLNPIWIFIALLAGARVAGLLGVILSIPVAGTIKSTIEEMRTLDNPQTVTATIIPPENIQV